MLRRKLLRRILIEEISTVCYRFLIALYSRVHRLYMHVH